MSSQRSAKYGLFPACALIGVFALGAFAEKAAEPCAGHAVRAVIDEQVEAEWIAEDIRFQKPAASADPVTTAQDAAGAVDGNKTVDFGFHTASNETDPWWQVDLGSVYALDRVVVYNRTCPGTAERTRHLRVLLSDEAPDNAHPESFRTVYEHDGSVFYGTGEDAPLVVSVADKAVSGRTVRLMVPGQCSFALVEVEVYGVDDPERNIALDQPADQISIGPHSRPSVPMIEGPTFSLDHTNAILDRTDALFERLASEVSPSALESLRASHTELRAQLEAWQHGDVSPEFDTRRELYMTARWVLRDTAFLNPMLREIDRLLFVKRHDPGGVFHMCDQYYGFNAIPGGGLFVLESPFEAEPHLRNLLEGVTVEQGRLAGTSLDGGSFLSPEVCFDGATLYFAYTQAKGQPGQPELNNPPPEEAWTPETSFHIFRVNANGSGLVQLTDGPENDFDPCVLPDGRIAFISERRGGFLRCGRHCPVYTLFSMEPDGSDIVCLSFHETHEWNPSVDHNGMIVYTRWDYVDRDTNVAHHKWITFPDGRDPRALHGNYPSRRRRDRPWMEMQIRAVPDSHRYVAVAAAHHGHEFGSLVLIDPRIEDDGAMAQLTRLTPETPFPESELMGREGMVYGTPWPLSEMDYLCVYDADAQNRGIFWIDADGNRELIYRDPEISCISPMPLQARPKPPIIPAQTTQTVAARKAAGGERSATIRVANVYESDFEWPPDTRIHALRIIQALPKTTPAPNVPRIGVAEQTNARAVLGTAPVEVDGSAHFEAPVGKAIYFQALDEHGMAVQSMRSATYVHPGEQLTCLGCHENKHTTSLPSQFPSAFGRDPSPISPEPEGSNPFSFVRLVQPVLDRRCVDCHDDHAEAPDLTGAIESNGFSRAYNNLAPDFGFYFQVMNGSFHIDGSRTIPGKFGARASRLMAHLADSHHEVSLTDEERRRLIVWLDANSEFYGAYEDIEAQQRGEIVIPSLD